jgi:hypothetical protein
MAVQNVLASVKWLLGLPGVRMCQSMMQYIPRLPASVTSWLTWLVNPVGSVRYPPSSTYMAMRKTSAPMVLAMKSRDWAVRHTFHPCHWIPWLLIPRNWMALPQEFTSWLPTTRNFPLTETGEANRLEAEKRKIPQAEIARKFLTKLQSEVLTFFRWDNPISLHFSLHYFTAVVFFGGFLTKKPSLIVHFKKRFF